MYEDALKVFYSTNVFVFHSRLDATLKFLQDLSKGALTHLRRIGFIFEGRDIESWKPGNWRPKFRDVIAFIKDNLNVPKLSIEVDTRVGALDVGTFTEELAEAHFLFDMYVDLVEELKLIQDVGHLSFDNGWFMNMGPLMAKEVIGSRYKGKELDFERAYERQQRVPTWWFERYPNSVYDIPEELMTPRGGGGGGGGRKKIDN